MGLLLGLDIGVSSVGYGIVDEYGEAIDAGVRLFTEGTRENNADRRAYRHQRRTIRRKHHRLVRADRLFVSAGLVIFNENKQLDLQCPADVTPYHLRVKGLQDLLTNKELVIALRHLLKYRGSISLNDYTEPIDGAGDCNISTKAIIAKTRSELDSGRFVCEIQLSRLLTPEIAHVRGVDNRFLTSDYLKEAKQILKTQQKYNPLVTDAFFDAYLNLLECRRAYYEGPGLGSPFAWADEEEWMARLSGTCVYTGQPRIVKHAPTAELFNLLNDLNNMLIDGHHLTYEEKTTLLETVFFKQVSSPPVKKLLSVLCKPAGALVTGLRTSGKGHKKQIFTELKGWHYIQSANLSSGATFNMADRDTADEIARILTVYQDKVRAANALRALELSPAFVDALVMTYDSSSGNLFSGTHSLSKEAISLIFDDLLKTSKNQMQLFAEKKIRPQHGAYFLQNGKVNPAIVNNMAVSAVTRRAISQAFTVFNDLMEKYPQGFERITVEMARERNSADRKKFIASLQRTNEQLNSQVREILMNNCDGKLFEKVKLWLLQDSKDIYTGEAISIDDLLRDSTSFEVDHIIPISISFDDSFNNKVLTRLENNQSKGQRTPYQWMCSPGAPDYNAFVLRVTEIKDPQKISYQKRMNLLIQEDTNKWDVRRRFINRNLVDTRYACKEVALILKECLKQQGTVVHTVNGSFTHYLRKLWGLNKDRDVDYSHHAVDALVAAASSLVLRQLNVVQNYLLLEDEGLDTGIVVDRYTGELVEDAESLKLAIERFKRYGRSYGMFRKFKYSHKIDKKTNRGLCNDTLYSTRICAADGAEYKLGKIPNLYDPKVSLDRLKEFFVTKPEKLLLYEGDRATYQKLQAVYTEYKEKTSGNPFTLYYQEHGYLTKHSFAGTGPIIKSLRFYAEKVGANPLDLSDKYHCKPGKRVIMDGLTTYRLDVYKAIKGYKVVRIAMSMLGDSAQSQAQLMREMAKQKITENDMFVFSLYPNDLFRLDGQLYRFCGYKGGNQISAQYVNRMNQNVVGKPILLEPTIGTRTLSVEKICSDALGLSVWGR